MQKSKIEWTDYTINPVKGLCPMACSYCYARRMYKRFKWDKEIKFDQLAFAKLPMSGKVFVGSTMELFGNWVEPEWLETIFHICANRTENTFIFLTKQPQNIIKYSPFPKNCWIGVSATDMESFHKGINALAAINAKVKFVSVEPLLQSVNIAWMNPECVNWVIIGQQTPQNKKTQPKIEWVKEIVDASDNAKIPVFLKNNLTDLLVENDADWAFDCTRKLRQEMPVVSP